MCVHGNLLDLADRGAFATDLHVWRQLGGDCAPAVASVAPVAPVAPLPFVPPVGPILCSPAVSAEMVEAQLTRAQKLAQAEITRLNELVTAEGASADHADALAFARGRVRALGRALDYLSRAATKGATLAAQTPSGAWMVIGSKGDRYRLEREGLIMTCSCEHGERLKRGEPVKGECFHLALIFAVEDAQDETYGLTD